MATTITANGINFPDGSASAPSIGGTDTNTGLFTGSDIVGFATGGVERIKIASNGNVSIGNNPTVHVDTIFHIEDSGETNIKIEGSTSTLGARISLQNNDTTANSFSQYAFNDAGGQSTSAIQGINTDQTNNYGEMAFLTRNAQGLPPSERVRIDKDGNVGIGTSSPGYKLEVVDSGGALLKLNTSHEGTYDLRFVYQNSEANIWSYGSTDLTFGTRYNKKLHLVTNGPSKRLTIDGSGNVGIGTTSPAVEFHVKGGGTVAKFEGTGGNGFISLADADDNTQLFIGCDGGSFKIQTSGNSWADKFIVNQAGHLGLKTAPNAAWSVGTDNSVLQIKNGVLWDYAGVQLDLGHNFYYTGSGYKFIRSGYASRITQHNNDGHIGFWSGGTGSADGDITWAESLRITSAGKIGIGITAPPDKLNVVGAVRINQSSALDHLCNAGTMLEVRGDGIGSGVVDYDFFKGFKIALNDGTEYGGQAQFAVGRWQENGTNARSSLMISLGHGAQSSSANADSNIMLLTSDGQVRIEDGNLKIGTAGHGIDFSATGNGNGTMGDELLDDYEQGTWSPTIYGGTTAGSYSYESIRTGGKYTKIGNMVYVEGVLRISAINSAGAGDLYMGGFPYSTSAPMASAWVIGKGVQFLMYGTSGNNTASIAEPPFVGTASGGASAFNIRSYGKNLNVMPQIEDFDNQWWIFQVAGWYPVN